MHKREIKKKKKVLIVFYRCSEYCSLTKLVRLLESHFESTLSPNWLTKIT